MATYGKQIDKEAVRQASQQASTEELLDRVTILKNEFHKEAYDVILEVLRERGVTREQVQRYEEKREQAVFRDSSGHIRRCDSGFCKNAIATIAFLQRTWHLYWFLPFFVSVKRRYMCTQCYEYELERGELRDARTYGPSEEPEMIYLHSRIKRKSISYTVVFILVCATVIWLINAIQ